MTRHDMQTKDLPVDTSARQRIVAAARASFFAQGFRSVTMDDLAQELGMSKKTLYAHFPSKTALLEALLLEKFRDTEAELARITSECAADFLTGLHRLLMYVQKNTEEVQPPFLRDMQREGPELFKVIESRRRQIIQRYFGKLLEGGRREGLIRKDIPVHIIIEILLGAVEAIMRPPRMLELGLTPASGFNAIITVILEGALNPKGRSAG